MEHLNGLVQLARQTSPYLAQHFKSIGTEPVTRLEDLPIIDHTSYWTAARKDQRSVLTGRQFDGIVFTTGGTSSKPKLTLYSHHEQHRAAHLVALGLQSAGVQPGDRIANLFTHSGLHGSFIQMTLGIQACPIPAIVIPIGSASSPEAMLAQIEQCETSVLLGSPTTLVALAEHCVSNGNGRQVPGIRLIAYGGEMLFERSEQFLRKAFPNARIRSVFYGSIDGGMIASGAAGRGSSDSRQDEDHRLLKTWDSAVMMEIISDSSSSSSPSSDPSSSPGIEEGRVIHENGITGTIVATNLLRQLQPVIRYPTGDRAQWVDKRAGVFRLMGRAQTAIRLGPVSLDMSDLRLIVERVVPACAAVQAVVRLGAGERGVDELECVVAAAPADEDGARRGIVELLDSERPPFAEQVARGAIAPLKVKFVKLAEMQVTAGSGKLREVVDLRFAA